MNISHRTDGVYVIESVYLLSDVSLWLPRHQSPQPWLPKTVNPCWKFDRGLFSLWSPPNFWKIPVAPPRVAEEWALEMKAEEESYNCFHSKAESSKAKPRQVIYEVRQNASYWTSFSSKPICEQILRCTDYFLSERSIFSLKKPECDGRLFFWFTAFQN